MVDLDPNIPAIMGDEANLKQVWMHLLNNAFEAIPKEGLIAVVTKLATDKGSVLISLADSGPGINPEDQAKIFEPFFNTKSTSLDIGLGLSFSYAVIKDHLGKIAVYSPIQPEFAQEMARSGNSIGPGTQFLIEMPVTPQEAPNTEVQELTEPPAPPLLPF